MSSPDRSQLDSLVGGTHNNPFALLGVHRDGSRRVVRTLQPQAEKVELLDRKGRQLGEMERIHPGGVFEGILPPRLRTYRLRVTPKLGDIYEIDDPYRFGTSLGELDLHLLREGSHQQIYQRLGAHPMRLGGIAGTRFAVWAPNASRVSVIGAFNDWDGRRHAMRLHPGNGIWEIFVPGVGHGEHYKYELLDKHGRLLPLKSDPYAKYHEGPPHNAAIVYKSRYRWRDTEWMAQRRMEPALDTPLSIYEVHLGSWRRAPDDHNRYLTYHELAEQLVIYVKDMGYTHIELLPVTEHPFDGSWGYQPIGLFSPTERFGAPDDFRYLVDRCHQAGIGVIVDWVPAHFPRDEHGLRRFDGSALYEHEDPRRGEHADWGTLIFNYGRREVANYLIGSARCWIEEFHIDGLRVDAVASMLYLDYSRETGEWLPNEYGGNENLEAVAFLKRLNAVIHQCGAISLAEESTAWPGVSKPVEAGGLGFTYKWNMGWMNDSLSYMSENAIHRKHHHDKMTFGLVYAFNENFVLPLSHDEVVHGKGSLIGKMPGNEWQRFANLRAYYTLMFCHPGKKLLFMGAEFAQSAEWNHDQSLDWHLLQYDFHAGVQHLIKDLNALYRSHPALYARDFTPDGFTWLIIDDRDNSVFAWLRHSPNGDMVAFIVNFTPVERHDYRLGVPANGDWQLLLSTDNVRYGGADARPPGTLAAKPEPCHNQSHSVTLKLPALSALVLAPGK
jgi:1,4-alpha-glucan branching enzyme